MITRPLDSINIRRSKRSSTDAAGPTESGVRRPSLGTSGLMMATFLLVGAFFLATRPNADSGPAVPSTAQPVAPTTSSSNPGSSIGPPQPDQSQSLERTVILDRPLATSKAQDGTSGVAASSSTTETQSVSPDSFALRILNGSGQAGLASQTQSALAAKGFRITETGTAVHDYATTIIYYTATHEAQAKVVQSAFQAGKAKMQQDDIAQPADVLLVIGADATSS